MIEEYEVGAVYPCGCEVWLTPPGEGERCWVEPCQTHEEAKR